MCAQKHAGTRTPAVGLRLVRILLTSQANIGAMEKLSCSSLRVTLEGKKE